MTGWHCPFPTASAGLDDSALFFEKNKIKGLLVESKLNWSRTGTGLAKQPNIINFALSMSSGPGSLPAPPLDAAFSSLFYFFDLSACACSFEAASSI